MVELIATAAWIGLPAVAMGELRTGFLLGNKRDLNERELRSFIGSEIVHVLEVDDETSTLYAEIVVALRSAGTPLPTNDIWIAALAAREGAPVLTYDEHFALVTRVGTRILTA